MTIMRRNTFGVVFCLLTVLSVSLIACHEECDHTSSALVQGPADSLLLTETGRWAYQHEYTGSEDIADYDLLVIDGDTYDPDDLDEELLADEALNAGVPVLLLDGTADHKDEGGLEEIIGASSGGHSWGYLVVPYPDAAGRTHYYVVDFIRPDVVPGESYSDEAPCNGCADGITPPDPGELESLPPRANEDQIMELEDSPLSEFSDVIRDLVENGPPEATNALSSDPLPDVPADLAYRTFTFNMQGRWWPSCKDEPDLPSFSITNRFTVYLNNGGGEEFRYVHLSQDGILSPGGLIYNSKSERGYFHTRARVVNTPASGGLIYHASSPATTNDTTEVTDSTTFDVTFKLSKTPGADGHYQVSHTETRIIQDWRVDELSSSTNTEWEYRQQYPYDPKVPKQWENAFTSLGAVKAMPNLSTSTLQLHTQSVWRTQNEGKASVKVDYYESYDMVNCQYKLFLGACLGSKQYDEQGPYWVDSKTYTIDLSSITAP